MDVVCLVNYYPIRQEDLSPAIDAFWTALEDAGIDHEPGPLQTVVRGPQGEVFAALERAWDAAHELGPGAMEVTFKEDRDRDVPGWDLEPG